MKKTFLEKVANIYILITLLLFIILYYLDIIAKHYIFGEISLILLLIIYVLTITDIILLPKKEIISISVCSIVGITIFIVHLCIINNPFKYKYETYEDGIKLNEVIYKIENEYKIKDLTFEIPSYIEGKELKVIGNNPFYNVHKFFKEEIVLPDTVEIIEDYGFNFNYHLNKRFTLSKNLHTIGYHAFGDRLDYLFIPKSVKYIKSGALTWQNSIVLEGTKEGIQAIGEYQWYSQDDIIYENSQVLYKDNVTYLLNSDNTSAVLCTNAIANKIEILDKVEFNNKEYTVTTIKRGSFESITLEEVIIPNTITTIESRAFFRYGDLKKIAIPKSVIYMGKDIFTNGDKDLIIYVEHNKKPDTWDNEWNLTNKQVIWNSK